MDFCHTLSGKFHLFSRKFQNFLLNFYKINEGLRSKWHLGNHKYQYTPTFRGFQSHMGYWGGKEDYFDHTNHCKVTSD